MAIKGFFGRHRFLSNFWPCLVNYEGLTFPSVENAYQAAKCSVPEDRFRFHACTAAEAKKRGRAVKLRPDWDQVKLSVMEDLVWKKFCAPDLGTQLLDTGDQFLEETNTWGDRFWGVCNGTGLNHLGKILMKVREELRS